MHTYLDQILEDLRAAQAQPPEATKFFSHEAAGDPIQEVEAFLKSPQHDFAYWTGISQEALPPLEALPADRVQELVDELKALWRAHKVEPLFPPNTPAWGQYRALRACWTSEVGTNVTCTFDFCTGYAPDCVLEDFCPCKETWEAADEEE